MGSDGTRRRLESVNGSITEGDDVDVYWDRSFGLQFFGVGIIGRGKPFTINLLVYYYRQTISFVD